MQITASSQLGGIAGNLYCQLAGRSHDKRSWFSQIPFFFDRVAQQVVDDRNQESRCFAGACLRFTRHVMSGQSVDKALRLNRGTKLKTELIDCLSERFLQLKMVERQLLLAGCVCHD